MDWALLFRDDRFEGGARRPDDNRNAFQIDQDRIVFSRPFRRLQKKTQVHPLPTNAHVRNRLVHTLEVASVGRSLGFATGTALREAGVDFGRTPDDLGYLVQATCLAHDIGNPPFGHAGEEVIAEWMAGFLARSGSLGLDPDLAHFDGNAQGFRILTRADGYRQRGGMKLTLATLAAFLKYPWDAGDPRAARGGRPGVKFGHFATEAAAFAAVWQAAGLAGENPRHPAVWLMEAADDIVYSLADLEDAVELGMIGYGEYRDLVAPCCTSTRSLEAEETVPQRIAYLRARAIGTLIEACKDAFLANREAILAGAVPPRQGLLDLCDGAGRPHAAALAAIKAHNARVIYFHPRKIEFEIGAQDVLGKALDVFVPACLAFVRSGGDRAGLTHRQRQVLSLMQDYEPRADFSPSENIRCAIDFVAGMTDDYASYLAARLRGLDPAL
ncbi:deoxyguanosinetriphosphate triphosphohydrolase [Falsiroseomonas bella]|uniref:Deoxyguanosinetriphosphate triphosphohydrolase n=1 Tax=Falsiroseomonas bella TaxID=2184016 RepID=A0A317F9S9_9PROT|nr:dNTP triphosphohydrolase [Falsiroseomonas bella]PWS35525.1 deoxyguanosinetriphosphate triphosphohydrolase [Falsiroseomonas bella]